MDARTGRTHLAAPRGGALRAWRNRWFWQRQARRLRGETAGDGGQGVSVYPTLRAMDHAGDLEPLCALNLTLEQGVPATDPDAALRQRLARELRSPAIAGLLRTPDGTVGGYAWGRVDKLAAQLADLRQTPALAHIAPEDWQRLETKLAKAVGDQPVLAVHAIGLAYRWRRGLAPLKQLLRPLLELGVRTHAHAALWYAPRGTPVHHLAVGFGANVVADVGGLVFFLHPDIRPLARIFAALPASVIADGLAKVLAPRATAPARAPARIGTVPQRTAR